MHTIPSHWSVLTERGAELLDEGEERWECIVAPNKSFRLAFSSYPERPVNHPSTSSPRESKPS